MTCKGFAECTLVGDFTVPIVSLMRAVSVMKLFKYLFDDVQIEDLWIPYFCVSTNLSRAEVVVHDEGPLWWSLRASTTVPGVSPPIPHKGDLLVDGGVLNNFPVDIMRERCRGLVIGVDVLAPVELRTGVDVTASTMSGWPHLMRALNPLDKRDPFPNILRILTRTATVSSVHNQELMRERADLYLHPPTDHIDILNTADIPDIVDIGYRYAYDKVLRWMGSDARNTGIHAALRRTPTGGV